MKFLTRSEAETKRHQAVEFLHRIGHDDQAEQFESMSPEEFAEHKGAELLDNPNERKARRKRGFPPTAYSGEADHRFRSDGDHYSKNRRKLIGFPSER